MRGIATHTQVHKLDCYIQIDVFLFQLLLFISVWLIIRHVLLQAMSAQTSVAVGMKGASNAMAAMNKVRP